MDHDDAKWNDDADYQYDDDVDGNYDDDANDDDNDDANDDDEDTYLPTEFIQSSPHDEDVVQEASIAIA